MADILPFTPQNVFDDQVLRIMGEAFEMASTSPICATPADAETLAGLIISGARTGERRVVALCDAALAGLRVWHEMESRPDK